jgi:excisionase family DNA binding protein
MSSPAPHPRGRRADDVAQPPSELLTPEQAAAYLGISVELLRKETLDGAVPATQSGDLLLYSRTALDEMLQRTKTEGDK